MATNNNNTNISTSELDFYNIKESIKSYLNKQSEFADYNFEGSALSTLLDTLAYNTHVNGLIANFALNESFLNTAQLRSSVVNIAAGLGYTPRSATSARARITATVNLSGLSNRPQSLTLPAGTLFNARIGIDFFDFSTQDEYVAYDYSGYGIYTFGDDISPLSIEIIEGKRKEKTFLVDTVSDNSQIYVITDSNVDLSTLKVHVYNDINSESYEEYTNINTLSAINADSKFYYINETYNGFYELNFGVQATLGKSPEPGNVIKVYYISPSGKTANGINKFTSSEEVRYNDQSFLLNITTDTPSALGDLKEPIESIRINAPVSYAAQRRLVTADDYIGVISNSVQGIKSVNSWGGEDNIPARYGAVMLSIIYEDDVDAADQSLIQQSIIENITDKFSIISIDTHFVEPETQYLDVAVQVYYDNALTGLTNKAIEKLIRETVADFFTETTGKFNDTFRKSKLISRIDLAEPSILSSQINVRQSYHLTPILSRPYSIANIAYDYTVRFLNSIKEPNSYETTVESDVFIYKGISCKIQNIKNSTQLEIVDLLGNVKVNNIGYYDPIEGVVYIQGLLPDSISSGKTYINISSIPSNDSVIKPLRNYVINLGTSNVVATPDTDKANMVASENVIKFNPTNYYGTRT